MKTSRLRSRYLFWLRRGSLSRRLVLAAGLWILVGLGAGGFFLTSVFRDYVESEFDQRLESVIDSMVGASEIGPEGFVRFTRPLSDQKFVQPYSGLYWQVSGPGEEPFRSRSLWDQELAADLDSPAFVMRFRAAQGPDGQRLRLAERDIQLPGSETVYRYMAAADVSAMETEIARFNTIVAWSLGALGAGLILAMILQVIFGLYPLTRLRRGLADVRAGRAKRLKADVPAEIGPLVEEMNKVLDYNDALVERARTHVGNLAHALKTPLSVMANELDRSGSSELNRLLSRQAEIISHQIEHHLTRARALARGALPGIRTDVGPAVQDLVRTLEHLARDKKIAFEVDVPEELYAQVEREDLDELLGNLLENAVKWCESRIRISALDMGIKAGQAWLCIDIEDDGPGVPAGALEKLFERGKRMDESKPGSGLGLAIVREITEMCGGKIKLDRADLGGLKVSLILPAWTELP